MNTTHTSNLLEENASTSLVDMARPCIVRAADVTLQQGAPGESGAFLLTAAHTAGVLTMADAVIGPNSGPPPHIHGNEEEIFLVESGALELLAGGELVVVRAGDVAYMARGEAHRFRGLDVGEPNRVKVIVPPSGFEDFMARWAPLFENGAPDMQQAVQLCAEYGITLFPSDDLAPVAAAPKTKIIRGSASHRSLQVLGINVTMLLSPEDTNDQYSLLRLEGPRDAGPPPHVHDREDELFVIEEGRVEFLLDEETIIAEAGDVVWAPRGWAHTFRIASERARMTNFMTPGNFGGYFHDAEQLELSGGATLESMVALGERYGLTFLLPTS